MRLTIGKYIPQDSPIHRLDPRTKILGIFFQITSIMLLNKLTGYVLVVILFFFLVQLSKIPLKTYLKSLKSLWFLIFFAGVIQLIFSSWELSLYIVLRLVFIFLFSSFLTYTTPPLLIARGISKGLKAFGIKDSTREDFSLMMSIAIRFIPILLDEVDRIMKAQISRGADYYEKSLIKRINGIVSLVVPLLVSALRKADEVALALQARRYGITKRSEYFELSFKIKDYLYLFANLLFLVLILISRRFGFV